MKIAENPCVRVNFLFGCEHRTSTRVSEAIIMADAAFKFLNGEALSLLVNENRVLTVKHGHREMCARKMELWRQSTKKK